MRRSGASMFENKIGNPARGQREAQPAVNNFILMFILDFQLDYGNLCCVFYPARMFFSC